jgi:uncharacterized protein (TIGR03085 family)
MMLRSVWDQVSTRSPGQERFIGRLVDGAGTPEGYAALVGTFASGPSPRSLMGRFDEALNLVEYVVHHEDLRRGSGPVSPRDLPGAELTEIWRRARPILKRAYRKAPVEVELAPADIEVAPIRSGQNPVTLSGPSLELVLHAFGRRGAAVVSLQGPPDRVAAFTRWSSAG